MYNVGIFTGSKILFEKELPRDIDLAADIVIIFRFFDPVAGLILEDIKLFSTFLFTLAVLDIGLVPGIASGYHRNRGNPFFLRGEGYCISRSLDLHRHR